MLTIKHQEGFKLTENKTINRTENCTTTFQKVFGLTWEGDMRIKSEETKIYFEWKEEHESEEFYMPIALFDWLIAIEINSQPSYLEEQPFNISIYKESLGIKSLVDRGIKLIKKNTNMKNN